MKACKALFTVVLPRRFTVDQYDVIYRAYLFACSAAYAVFIRAEAVIH